MSPRLALCVILTTGVSAFAADQPITTAQAVRDLTPVEARRHWPVRLVGVVTHVNPQQGDFFIQDGTAGIYSHPNREIATRLKPKDRVELTGVTDAGGFAPCLFTTAVTPLGGADLPEPIPYNLSRDDCRWLDGQFVQGTAVVQSTKAGDGITRLEITSPNGQASLFIPGEHHLEKVSTWVNATVRFQGVCAPRYDNDRRMKGIPRLHVPSPDYVKVLRPASKATDKDPPALIESLTQFSPSPDAGGRWVKVSGIVTAVLKHSHFVVQDDTAGILVSPESVDSPPVALGNRVEAIGFVGFDNGKPHLSGARVRTSGQAPLPEPITIPDQAWANRSTSYRRVRLIGKLERHVFGKSGLILILSVGTRHFDVLYSSDPPEALRQLPVNSMVQVTAVNVPNPVGEGGSSVLLLQSQDDVHVVEHPPAASWWTKQRVVIAAFGLATLALASSAWVWTLRRQVRRQTTEIRAHFEKERELETRLKQAGKLEAMGQLAGGVAHDFNNLLTVINGCTDLLAERLAHDLPGRGLCDEVRKAGQRAAGLTSQLLLFSRRQPVVLTSLDLNDVLRDAEKLLSRVIGEHVCVETRYAPNLPRVRADIGYLNQVVLNLAVNARDAMPSGGTVTLLTTPDAFANGTAAVRLTVTDTGCGMDDATKARVFEPFFTTKPAGQGTGLGLATVYGIVQTLGGEVRLESVVGQGTSFHILLPTTEDERVSPLEMPATHRPTSVPVLLVEDDDGVRNFVQRSLELCGYAVTAVTSPHEAESIPDTDLRGVRVLLTDVVMPGKSGRELAEALRARFPALKVVFMSGYTGDEVLSRGVNDGEVAFLQKPFRPHDLIRALNSVLESNGN